MDAVESGCAKSYIVVRSGSKSCVSSFESVEGRSLPDCGGVLIKTKFRFKSRRQERERERGAEGHVGGDHH
jgi:hypothetical protein